MKVQNIKVGETYKYKELCNKESIKNNECYTCELTISVDNLEQLNKFINDLESIPNMLSVERLIK